MRSPDRGRIRCLAPRSCAQTAPSPAPSMSSENPGPWSRTAIRPGTTVTSTGGAPWDSALETRFSSTRSSRRGSTRPSVLSSASTVTPGRATTCSTNLPRSTQRRSAVADPLSSRAISSRSSTSVCSRSTRSRTAKPTWSGSSRLAAALRPVSGVRRSCATSATNLCSRSIRSWRASAMRSIAATQRRDLVVARGIDAGVEITGRHQLGSGSRAAEPQREPARQRDPDQRPAEGGGDRGADQLVAEVGERLLFGDERLADEDRRPPVRRRPARPDHRLPLPRAAVGREVAGAHRLPQRRRDRRVVRLQRGSADQGLGERVVVRRRCHLGDGARTAARQQILARQLVDDDADRPRHQRRNQRERQRDAPAQRHQGRTSL